MFPVLTFETKRNVINITLFTSFIDSAKNDYMDREKNIVFYYI
jgi:hypothetical protein